MGTCLRAGRAAEAGAGRGNAGGAKWEVARLQMEVEELRRRARAAVVAAVASLTGGGEPGRYGSKSPGGGEGWDVN